MQIISISWDQVKSFISSRSASIQYFDQDSYYEIHAFDNQLHVRCFLYKDTDTVNVADFETNYKANSNKSLPPQIQPFASKTLPNGKSLFKRFTGTSQSLSVGSNTFTWTQTSFPWVKFLGLEVIGAELGDICDLYVLDTSTGTYSGHANAVLNQFAYTANVAPSYYRHASEYDADLYQNLQIKFVYTSISSKTIYLNFDMNEVK